MTNLSDKYEPLDIAALVMIIGCIGGILIKPDPIFKEVLITITGFYFGRKSIQKQ